MTTVIIVIHLMVVLAMIGLVLLQRSEGGALGIGGSGNFLSSRGAGNVLTRSTAILAAVFFATSIGLTVLARLESRPADILDRLPAGTGATAPAPLAPPAPAGEPATGTPAGGVLDQLRQQSKQAPGPQPAPKAAEPEQPAQQ